MPSLRVSVPNVTARLKFAVAECAIAAEPVRPRNACRCAGNRPDGSGANVSDSEPEGHAERPSLFSALSVGHIHGNHAPDASFGCLSFCPHL